MAKLFDLFARGRPSSRPAPRPVVGRQARLHIVGEASYQTIISKIAKRREPFSITLRAEPTNPYDRNAVAVLVDGEVVGYLARDLAPRWQPAVLAAESEGFVVTGVAEVFGGTPDKPSLGVFGTAAWPGPGRPPQA